jgi:hypothetical protein
MRLQLHALAYNLGNFLRTLATPEPIKDWSLTSLKDKLIKNRREGGEPRPLCGLGGGRHRTANVPGDSAAHRGTAAAATTSASARFDSHAFKSNRRNECVGMPRKTVRSGSQTLLGRSGMSGTIHPLASGLPGSSENAYHPRQFRVHLRNPGQIQ